MINKDNLFSGDESHTIGWNYELLVFVPEDQSKRTFIAKCVYLKNNKMLIEKKSGDIALISINNYKDINLLYPKNCEVMEKAEVV
jgi:serine protease inhibitor ecotin